MNPPMINQPGKFFFCFPSSNPLLNKHSTIHGNQLIKETDNAVGVTTRPRYDLILINKNKNYKVSTTTSTTSLIPQDKSPSQSNKRQLSSSMGVQGSSPSQPSIWQPTAIPGVSRVTKQSLFPPWHPIQLPFRPVIPLLYNTVPEESLHLLQQYTQGLANKIILRLADSPSITVTTEELRNIISHNTPIHHEGIILSLAIICAHTGCKYIDPAFYPLLRAQGWSAVSRWFSRHPQSSKPSLMHDDILVPLHINNNHWVAFIRK